MAQTYAEHLVKCKECAKRLHDERISWGLCITCGKPLKGETTLNCRACLKRQADYRTANRERTNELTKERMRRYREAGLCIYCGKPVAEGSTTRCEYHLNYYRKIQRKGNKHADE